MQLSNEKTAVPRVGCLTWSTDRDSTLLLHYSVALLWSYWLSPTCGLSKLFSFDTTPSTGRRHRRVPNSIQTVKIVIQPCVASKLEGLTCVGWCHNPDSWVRNCPVTTSCGIRGIFCCLSSGNLLFPQWRVSESFWFLLDDWLWPRSSNRVTPCMSLFDKEHDFFQVFETTVSPVKSTDCFTNRDSTVSLTQTLLRFDWLLRQ